MDPNLKVAIQEKLAELPAELAEEFLPILDQLSETELQELHLVLTCDDKEKLAQQGLIWKREMESNVRQLEIIKDKFMLNSELS